MPKKRTDGFHMLTVDEQQEVIERFKGRKDVRDANRTLARLVLAWVLDRPISDNEFFKLFEAGGHEGQYNQTPTDTTFQRVIAQSGQLANITKRLSDTPLDYMGALELSYVYDRIQQMIETIHDTTAKNMLGAIELYRVAGATIRHRVYTETGHYPEEFPVPRGRITGDEAPKQFKLTDHQPPLI